MPTAESILAWATVVANDWRWLAILWHVALAALLIGFVTRVSLSARLVGYALVLPVISVSVIAWLSRNPFNGLILAVLAVVLVRAATRLPLTAVIRASSGWVVGGGRARHFRMGLPSFPHHGSRQQNPLDRASTRRPGLPIPWPACVAIQASHQARALCDATEAAVGDRTAGRVLESRTSGRGVTGT